MIRHILLLAVFGTSHFVRVPDHSHVHMALVNTHGVVVGEYLQHKRGWDYMAWCERTGVYAIAEPNRAAAEKYVERCPNAEWSGR
jgi:hypothetical protein